jgi:3-methyladenine DNA glycosylase AlkD
MNSVLVADIQRELEQNVDPSPKRSPQSFFKEEVQFHGVKSSIVGTIARQRFGQIQEHGKTGVFVLCEALLQTDYGEEAAIAFDWAYRLRNEFEPADFTVFERWLTKYVNNWAKCDTLCNHTVAAFVEIYPEFVERLKGWTASDNRWLRRAAAVTLILPARQGQFLKDIFEIADRLLTDADDLVQKGYGWMLKEAGKAHQREVFDYILARRAVMPRTALRYAVEKMPDDMRRRAMAKG